MKIVFMVMNTKFNVNIVSYLLEKVSWSCRKATKSTRRGMIKELKTIRMSGEMYSGKYFFKILSLDSIQLVKGLAKSKIVRGETRITQITKSKK
jgi:hypothetical protein